MPRYFFHLRSEDLLLEDPEGMDLPHLHAALAEVMRVRSELAADPAGVQGLAFEVTDGGGRILFKVPVQQGSRSPSLASRRNGADHGKRAPGRTCISDSSRGT